MKHFFGDGEYEFALTLSLIEEIERQTDLGLPSLARSLLADSWRARDVKTILRLSLVGGGLDPERATSIIEAYMLPTGLTKCALIALVTLSDLMGAVDDDDTEEVPA
ncbi:gene transfer agent family protein [Acuticoccus sediminis]|uniref:Gene transfer agent family protein n=1 Tax=Acuticoccus sediminis TaxID=2184697 RepID=A0A8B2NM96_9HYPH|nr:gene transfer agent family protein [Acuticoccus sediminis]RAH97625.1 gene transfer agent family protein [Acuticoccus sediminis]